MGRDLYDTFEVARQVVDEADEALGGTLKEIMFHGSQEDLTKTQNAQPAILATSIAMLRVLEREKGLDLGGSYDFALGHSLGEYSALVATGALPLSDAVKLVVSSWSFLPHSTPRSDDRKITQAHCPDCSHPMTLTMYSTS